MADTLTPKQEAFALKYVECGNASEAYRHAYNAENMKDEVIHVKASELLSHGKVSVRVKALRAELQKRHEITVDSLTKYLEDAIKLATSVKQTSTIVSAVKELGVLHGLRVEKSDHKVTHENALDLLK